MNKLSWEEIEDFTGWLVKLRQKGGLIQPYDWYYGVVCFRHNGTLFAADLRRSEESAIDQYENIGRNALGGHYENDYEIYPLRKIF